MAEKKKSEEKEQELGLTVKKAENFSEWFSQVVEKAGLADQRYNVKGFLVHQPWSVWIMKKMYRLYEEELERNDHKPVWFPVVIPKSNLETEKEHAAGFAPEVFWVTRAGSEAEEFEEPLALRPTSETAFYPMFSVWIRSYKDLPLKLYQSCSVFRYETKMTRPFIRGREFYWIETHNVFANEEDALRQVRQDMDTTQKIMGDQFGVPFIFFKRPSWDKFKGAVNTYAADSIMPDGKAIQQPSTHLLGQNFTKIFDVKFTDEKGNTNFAWSTTYGPCIWRMVASIIAVHGDDRGLILPPVIAPVHVVIVPIPFKGFEKEVAAKSQEIKKFLDAAGKWKIILDDRDDKTAGFKFNEWELKGVPLRIEIGPRDIKAKQVVIVRRDTGQKIDVKEDAAVIQQKIHELLTLIQEDMVKKASGMLKITDAASLEEVNDLADSVKGKEAATTGFIRAPWCSIDKDGESCAAKLKEKFAGLQVRGVKFERHETPKDGAKCIVCGREAKEVVYLAKAY